MWCPLALFFYQDVEILASMAIVSFRSSMADVGVERGRTEGSMMRKTSIALFALAAVGLVQPNRSLDNTVAVVLLDRRTFAIN